MRTNTVALAELISPTPLTHEGAKAKRIGPVEQLRRTVMSCMLGENDFYEGGKLVKDRIVEEVKEILDTAANGADVVANVAYEARTKFKLRHAPLWVVLALVRDGRPAAREVVAGLLANVIQRPDEIAEFIAMYWSAGKRPLTNQMKVGLRASFKGFSDFSIRKYVNKPGAVSMRDVMFLVHPRPENGREQFFKDLADKKLTAPDTWESALSAGADKKETFERLISEGQLGGLALLRNLRGMTEAKVSLEIITKGLAEMKTDRILPFRFITAARYAPQLEPQLEAAMFRCIEGTTKLKGNTLLLVDGSGSMFNPLSSKSEMTRWEAAAALAILVRETIESGVFAVFGTGHPKQVPPRRGFALRDVLGAATQRGGTQLGQAVSAANATGYDRLIIFTDEQSSDLVPDPLPGTKAYIINVASNRNGVGYGKWTHVDGMSEAVLDFIAQHEQEAL